MHDLITKIAGGFRWLIWWIDSLGFAFIDNAYTFMLDTMQGFNSEVVKNITGNLIQNAYIIVGIFALFRVAVTLINSIVNPDKLTDKKEGIGNILFHFVGAIVLFIVVPLIFDLSREVQLIIIGGEDKKTNQVYQGNYIPKLITGSDLNSNRNAGKVMQLIATKALVRPDEEIAHETTVKDLDENGNVKKDDEGNDVTTIKYVKNDNVACDTECQAALDAWNNNQLETTNISNYISSYVDVGDDNVFVYHYLPFITLAVGIFITYVLLSFTIDIAVRSVELVVLEVLSPIFIVTFVDPKMASSGPFSKWVKACTKSYLTLFIRVAIISLMLLLIANIDGLLKGMRGDSFLLKLLMIIAILIFAKKAPKWIGGMFGLDDGAGLGGLGIGKKLAGAALVGGAIGKGFNTVKGGIGGGLSAGYHSLKRRKNARKDIRKDEGLSHLKSGHNRRKELSDSATGGRFTKWAKGYYGLKKEQHEAYKAQGAARTDVGKAMKEGLTTMFQGSVAGTLSGISAKDGKEAFSSGRKAGLSSAKENYYGYKTTGERMQDKLTTASSNLQDAVFGDKYSRDKAIRDAESAKLRDALYKNLTHLSDNEKVVKTKDLFKKYDNELSSDKILASMAEGSGMSFKIGTDTIKDVKLDGNKNLVATVNGVSNCQLNDAQIKGVKETMDEKGMFTSGLKSMVDAYTAQSALNLANNSQGLQQQQQTIINNINQAEEGKATVTKKMEQMQESLVEFQELSKSMDKLTKLQKRRNEIAELEEERSKLTQQLITAGDPSAFEAKIKDINIRLNGENSSSISAQITKEMSANTELKKKFDDAVEIMKNNPSSEYARLSAMANNYDANLNSLHQSYNQINQKYQDIKNIIDKNTDIFKDDYGHNFNEGFDNSVIAALQDSLNKKQKPYDEQKNKILGKDKKD